MCIKNFPLETEDLFLKISAEPPRDFNQKVRLTQFLI